MFYWTYYQLFYFYIHHQIHHQKIARVYSKMRNGFDFWPRLTSNDPRSMESTDQWGQRTLFDLTWPSNDPRLMGLTDLVWPHVTSNEPRSKGSTDKILDKEARFAPNSELAHIYKELKFISDRMRDEDSSGSYEDEWKYAALVLDRFNLKWPLRNDLKGPETISNGLKWP